MFGQRLRRDENAPAILLRGQCDDVDVLCHSVNPPPDRKSTSAHDNNRGRLIGRFQVFPDRQEDLLGIQDYPIS